MNPTTCCCSYYLSVHKLNNILYSGTWPDVTCRHTHIRKIQYKYNRTTNKSNKFEDIVYWRLVKRYGRSHYLEARYLKQNRIGKEMNQHEHIADDQLGKKISR